MTTHTIDDSQVRAKLRALTQGVRVFVLEQGYRYVVPSSMSDGMSRAAGKCTSGAEQNCTRGRGSMSSRSVMAC